MPNDDQWNYEILADGKRVIARVYWDGKQVQTDPESYRHFLEQKSYNNIFIQDGLDFLKVLPKIYRSGYMSARRVKT